MAVISGINWGSNGVAAGSDHGTVSEKTNTSYTLKHSLTDAVCYRCIRIYPAQILPTGASLTKIIVKFNFRASTGSSHRAAVWAEGNDSDSYITSKSGLDTTDTEVSLSISTSSLTLQSDGSYRIGIGGYKSTLAQFYWYISNFDISLEYKISIKVTTSASPAEGGTVSGGGTYESGSTVTATATANKGYNFSYWLIDGNNFGNTNPISGVLNADTSVVAVFEKIKTNKIYQGTNQPKYIYIGDKIVKQVYLGTTLVFDV